MALLSTAYVPSMPSHFPHTEGLVKALLHNKRFTTLLGAESYDGPAAGATTQPPPVSAKGPKLPRLGHDSAERLVTGPLGKRNELVHSGAWYLMTKWR